MSGVKLRNVVAWMAVTGFVASLALAHLWKQRAHAGLSRETLKIARDRDALGAEVLLLETEVRALRQYSRIEAVARKRLGLIDPGPPVIVRPAGQVLAGKAGEGSIRSARWRGFP